jgi:hypothetical protein
MRFVLSVLCVALAAGCSGPGAVPAARPGASAVPEGRAAVYATTLIAGVPHVAQKPDFCGEAATEMVLRFRGSRIDQDGVFDLSGMDPARGMGVTTRELAVALRRLGFDPGPVWGSVPAADAAELEAQFAALHGDLRRGVPSIVCTRFDATPGASEHFRLVLGYDAATDEVVYSDPAVPGGGYLRMPRQRLLELWPLRYEPQRWTVIRLRLEGERVLDLPPARGPTSADYAQHVRALGRRLPRGFHVVVEPPFVVIGDGSPDAVRATAAGTVRWAVERLRRDFFPRDPGRILDVWLLRDAESYRRHTRELFDEEPDTPYGFYSRKHGALVMNIATGGGTLVHEIVHPYVEANLAGCPAWMNEGLGSLFEQSADRDGHIVGLTNWRLAGLKEAIRRGRLPSFRELTATSDGEFYGVDPGTNYAQARYLLLYLQERGLLARFWREAGAGLARDRTGFSALESVLGETDMEAFQRRWERWVLGLRFPPG